MTKVTIKEAGATDGGAVAVQPSKDGITRLKDADGREIGVKKPTALERVRLYEILGPESSQNVPVLQEFMPAYMVVEFDGDARPRPTTRPQLNARLMELGEDGAEVVSKWLIDVFVAEQGAISDDAKKAEETRKAALKNS